VHAALSEALPPGWFAPQRNDASFFSDFDSYELLDPSQRAQFAITPGEVRSMRNYRAVSGHFCLPTLLQVTEASSICTVLREPRARLLSVYMYWRIPNLFQAYEPYRVHLHAARSLNDVLSEPRLAEELDNAVCRRLLDDDPRLPPKRFARQCDVASIAADAIRRLETLGFVGVLESGESVWRGIGEVFGVTLRPAEANVTGDPSRTPLRMSSGETCFDHESFDLLQERSAADAIVYDHVLAHTVENESERARIREGAFARELFKYSDLICPVTESAAAETHPQNSAEIEELRAELQRSREELEQARQSNASIQGSASWRITAPLRAAKRRLSTQ